MKVETACSFLSLLPGRCAPACAELRANRTYMPALTDALSHLNKKAA